MAGNQSYFEILVIWDVIYLFRYFYSATVITMGKLTFRLGKRRRSREKGNIAPDKPLLLIIGIILIFGIVMIYDATVIYAQHTFGGPYRFVLLHIAWVFVGLLGFWFFYNYNYKKLDRIAYPLFVLTLVLLALLSFFGVLTSFGLFECNSSFGFVACINGVYRWFYVNPQPLAKIPFFGSVGFQPSELAKLSIILYLSIQLSKNKNKGFNSFLVYIVTSLGVAFLILLQPSMSTAALIFFIGSLIYFSSGSSLLQLFITFPILGVLGTLSILASEYRRERLLTLLGFSEGIDLSSGYHIKQILIALGSGGFAGLGFGQSRQKYQYLPEVFADSIFAIIGEELGFLGTTLIVILFSFFMYKGYLVARSSSQLLGRLLAVGITSWIGLQFFINVAAMVELLPLTGMPIPLISYGGSSMVFTLMGLGILANISKYSSNT
jgi:cell division protein FtsW